MRQIQANPQRLWDEYRLLQDKVDKIGAFRFTVKAWVVPSVGAFFAAIFTAKLPSLLGLLSLCLVAAFGLLEGQQALHQLAYLRRLREIEGFLKRRDADGVPHAFGPMLARGKGVSAPRTPMEAIEVLNADPKQGKASPFHHAHVVFCILVVLFVVAFSILAPSATDSNRQVAPAARSIDAGALQP